MTDVAARLDGRVTVVEHERFLGTDVSYALVAAEDRAVAWEWAASDRDVHVSVLRGSVTVTVGTGEQRERVEVHAGEWACIPAGVEHRVEGRGLLELLVPGTARGDGGG